MSKKPISIKDKPSKKALLEELESIKHLLDDEDADFEPPLLTQEVVSDDLADIPVLSDSIEIDEADIPTLDAAVEEDDIVSRAMRAQSEKNTINESASSSQASFAQSSPPKPATTTTPSTTKSLFDDEPSLDSLKDALFDQELQTQGLQAPEESSQSTEAFDDLSPEMLALNELPKDVKKASTPEPTEASKSEPAQETLKSKTAALEAEKNKSDTQQFPTLEKELEELANTMSNEAVDESMLETSIDADHIEATLKEFDDYLIEDDMEIEADNNVEDSEEIESELDFFDDSSDDNFDNSSDNSSNDNVEESFDKTINESLNEKISEENQDTLLEIIEDTFEDTTKETIKENIEETVIENTKENTKETSEEKQKELLKEPSKEIQDPENTPATASDSLFDSLTLGSEAVNENSEIDDQALSETYSAEKEASTASEEDLLEAAILEVTDSLSTDKLSQQVKESLEAAETSDSVDTQKTQSPKAEQKREHQPSLFDAPESNDQNSARDDEPLKTNSSNTESHTTPAAAPAASKTTKPAIKPAARKTENPFLPKHIRDRLHTNKTLQQEIDDSTAAQAATFASTIATGSNNPSASTSVSTPTATSTTTNSLNTTASNTPASEASSQEDRVIEEVVGSVLPKIENELRQKIRELINQEKSSK